MPFLSVFWPGDWCSAYVCVCVTVCINHSSVCWCWSFTALFILVRSCALCKKQTNQASEPLFIQHFVPDWWHKILKYCWSYARRLAIRGKSTADACDESDTCVTTDTHTHMPSLLGTLTNLNRWTVLCKCMSSVPWGLLSLAQRQSWCCDELSGCT